MMQANKIVVHTEYDRGYIDATITLTEIYKPEVTKWRELQAKVAEISANRGSDVYWPPDRIKEVWLETIKAIGYKI